MRAANKVAQQRMIIQTRRLKTFPTQLAAAEQLLKEGDLATACLIYQRIAVSRPSSTFSELAQNQLRKLRDEGRKEREAVDQRLASAMSNADEHPDQVALVFQEYRGLTKKYSGVPVIDKEFTKHVAKQRNNPEYAFVLNEAEARRLWDLAQEHEADGNTCCAHEVYAEASQLLPSKTAPLAMARLLELDRDPSLATKVSECRTLQECHKKFLIAESLNEAFPEEAAAQYRWISDNAPRDSEVFLASKQRLPPASNR